MKYLLFLSFLSLINCNDKNSNELANNSSDSIRITKDENPYMTNYENKERKKKLLNEAIIKGDTLAYQESFKDFSVSGHLQEFLYYSLKMAKNNNYSDAYFDTYYILNLLNNQNGFTSEKDKNESLFYLFKSYEMGNSNAKYKVKELYTDKGLKIPTSESLLNNK